MATFNVRSRTGEDEILKSLIIDGINEERKKIEYALSISTAIIREKENSFKITSADFLVKFKEGRIEENEDTFQWWAELKLTDTLKKQLATLADVEICQ